MKLLLLVCAVAAVVLSALAERVPKHAIPPEHLTYRARILPSQNFAARSFPSHNDYFTTHNLPSQSFGDGSSPSTDNRYSTELDDHHKAFLGPSVTKIFGDAELDRSEVVVLVGSGLAELMKASLENSDGSGIEEFKDVSLAMVGAARHVLETRVANGRHVSEEQFENLREVEERLSGVLEAITTIFDNDADNVLSLPSFYKEFDFDPVERSTFLARILPTVSKAVFQDTDSSTAENFRDFSNVFLVAIRQFLEDRVANGKLVSQEQFEIMERAERLMPPLMQAFVTVVHDKFLVEFMQRLQLDPTERAKYIVSGFFASMDAIFKDPNASVAQMMRDVTLAFMPPSRQVFEDRLVQGKPVTQENFDNLERMEKTLPIILDAYIKVVDDLGIP